MIVKIIVILIIFQLVGCAWLPPFPYRIDVQQGNVVTQEMVETLKLGMTKSQVRFVMGSPLVVDTFRENRWDYVYLQQEKGDLVEKKRLTIYFEEDLLVNIEEVILFAPDSEDIFVENAPNIESTN